MFVRLGNALGSVLYWIGSALAAIVFVQATILVAVTGSPLIPVLLGVAGLTVWLIAITLKYFLTRR
jgi:hypothetical protein